LSLAEYQGRKISLKNVIMDVRGRRREEARGVREHRGGGHEGGDWREVQGRLERDLRVAQGRLGSVLREAQRRPEGGDAREVRGGSREA
jgi:hypothetical protein